MDEEEERGLYPPRVHQETTTLLRFVKKRWEGEVQIKLQGNSQIWKGNIERPDHEKYQ